MAVEINEMDRAALVGLPVDARSRIGVRAVFCGIVVMLAVQLLLIVLGAAVGVTAVRPSTEATRGVGIGLYAWLLISFCISAFVGAWFASSVARSISRGEGMLHGFLLWGALALASTWLMGGAISSALGGALGVASTASQSGAGTALGLWGLFLLLLLPLFAALLGGAAGARRIDHLVELRERQVVRTTTVTPSGPIAPIAPPYGSPGSPPIGTPPILPTPT